MVLVPVQARSNSRAILWLSIPSLPTTAYNKQPAQNLHNPETPAAKALANDPESLIQETRTPTLSTLDPKSSAQRSTVDTPPSAYSLLQSVGRSGPPLPANIGQGFDPDSMKVLRFGGGRFGFKVYQDFEESIVLKDPLWVRLSGPLTSSQDYPRRSSLGIPRVLTGP